MPLTDMQAIVLARVFHDQMDDLRELGERGREAIIGLGVMDPPLVDTRADEIFITEAGIAALRHFIHT